MCALLHDFKSHALVLVFTIYLYFSLNGKLPHYLLFQHIDIDHSVIFFQDGLGSQGDYTICTRLPENH